MPLNIRNDPNPSVKSQTRDEIDIRNPPSRTPSFHPQIAPQGPQITDALLRLPLLCQTATCNRPPHSTLSSNHRLTPHIYYPIKPLLLSHQPHRQISGAAMGNQPSVSQNSSSAQRSLTELDIKLDSTTGPT